MIVDVVMFDDEFDMLDCRLYQLSGIVDRFIICEADRTFSGIPKPYLLSEAIDLHRYDGYPITVVRAETGGMQPPYLRYRPWITPESAHAWWREGTQRSAANGILYGLPDDAVVLYGDLDEIPRRWVVAGFEGTPAVLSMEHLMYSTRTRTVGKWAGTVIGRKGVLGNSPHDVREVRWNFRIIENGGWHLSWFGDPDRREAKLAHSAHQELIPKIEGRVGSELPEQGIHLDGESRLLPYGGDLPKWIEDGHAPADWTREW